MFCRHQFKLAMFQQSVGKFCRKFFPKINKIKSARTLKVRSKTSEILMSENFCIVFYLLILLLEKPGKCPPVDAPPDPLLCQAAQPDPQGTALCGLSANGGGAAETYDWDCPGETKCCLDPLSGCFQVCTDPQNGNHLVRSFLKFMRFSRI